MVKTTLKIDGMMCSMCEAHMNDLVRQGKSIIMISSEMPELLRMSDRGVVMCEGVKTGELPIEEATQEKIMTLATQHTGG